MKKEEINEDLDCYIHYHEYDFNLNYPVLVIRGRFGSQGYNIDKETGQLKRTCICAAHNEYECICDGFQE